MGLILVFFVVSFIYGLSIVKETQLTSQQLLASSTASVKSYLNESNLAGREQTDEEALLITYEQQLNQLYVHYFTDDFTQFVTDQKELLQTEKKLATLSKGKIAFIRNLPAIELDIAKNEYAHKNKLLINEKENSVGKHVADFTLIFSLLLLVSLVIVAVDFQRLEINAPSIFQAFPITRTRRLFTKLSYYILTYIGLFLVACLGFILPFIVWQKPFSLAYPQTIYVFGHYYGVSLGFYLLLLLLGVILTVCFICSLHYILGYFLKGEIEAMTVIFSFILLAYVLSIPLLKILLAPVLSLALNGTIAHAYYAPFDLLASFGFLLLCSFSLMCYKGRGIR